MARPKGRNLSEAERVLYGDRALALKLAGKTYDEITAEVPIHRNTVGPLIREAARRRSQDRDITEEINRGIAVQRQLVEDLLRDFRSIGSGTPHRANARAKVASQIIKAQMNLLFLSGVEVPDPEKVVADALAEAGVQMPGLPDPLLSYPEVFAAPLVGTSPPFATQPEEPPEDHVIPERATARVHVPPEDDDHGIFFDGPGEPGDSYFE